VLLGLTACGDSSSGKGGVAETPSGTGTINSTNAAAVAADVLNAFVVGPDTTGAIPLGVSSVQTGLAAKRATLADFARQQYKKAIRWRNQLGLGVVRPQTHTPDHLPCANSGFVTISVTVDPITLLADSMTLLYENCIEFGETTDGTVSVTAIAGSLITDPFACPGALSFKVSFDDLSVNDGVDLIVIDGSFDFSSAISDQDGDLICETVTDTLSGSPLNVTLNGETSTLSNFNISDTVNSVTGDFTSTFSGTVVSTAAGGSVSVMTTPAITGNVADTYPSSGQFTITTGSEILTVRINSNVAAAPNAVTISLDSDGDGTPDGPPQDYSWDELVAVV
jgi:hypothetical protein